MKNSKALIHIALFAALICALTLFPAVPAPAIPGSYIHLGDAVILIAVYFIGRKAVLSASIGSAIADLLVGGALIYAPATLVIKAVMAFLAYIILGKQQNRAWAFLLAALVSELCMAAGYFLYETALYGAALAAMSMPANFIQTAGSIVFGATVYLMVRKTRLKDYFDMHWS